MVKLKQIDRTAATAWAPFVYQQEQSYCPLMATGSVAGAMDASFSSTTELEVFALDLAKSGSDGVVKLGGVSTPSRLVGVWSTRCFLTLLCFCCSDSAYLSVPLDYA